MAAQGLASGVYCRDDQKRLSNRRGSVVLALLWSDIDVDKYTVSVTKTVNRMNEELKVQPPKTPKSIRTVAIPAQAIAILIQEHEEHPDNPYLFPSPKTGTMYDPSTIRRIHRKLLQRAGIEENVRFHDLRRTFTTLMIQNGADLKTLSAMLGHYSAAFTLDVYGNVTNIMQTNAAEKIGAFMETVI